MQHNLALIFEARGEFERALQLLILSLQALDSLPPTHLDLIRACANVGRLASRYGYLIAAPRDLTEVALVWMCGMVDSFECEYL